MTKKNYTEIAVIMDKSGSMGRDGKHLEAIDGFNAFLKEQQDFPDGEANLTLTFFDTEFHVIHDGTPIRDVPEIDNRVYQPEGYTAMLDAIADAINRLGNRLEAMDERERPGVVIVAILTDGLENSSKEYTYAQVREMVEHQSDKYNWKFVYLAQGEDAVLGAQKMGIDPDFTQAYADTRVGTQTAYRVSSSVTTSLREGDEEKAKRAVKDSGVADPVSPQS